MTSSSYLELLKLKRTKLLKVVELFESGVSERSDYVNRHLCDSDNVPSIHSKDAVLKLSFITCSNVKLECPKKTLVKIMDLFCDNYLLCSAPDCGYMCRSPSQMARHNVILHSGEKPFKCSDCNYASIRKYLLKEHQVRIHSKSTGCKKVFVCEFDGCNYRTTFNSRAIMHRRKHLEIKPFKCHHPNSGRSFVTESCLKRHKMVHSKKKRFKCMQNNCTYATNYRFNLKSHLANHSTVRAFRRAHNNCTYAAKQRSSLWSHSLTHSEAKPFKCDYENCNFSTKHKRVLKDHNCLHTNCRPFKCDYKNCSYAAIRRKNLVQHIRCHERKPVGKGEK